MRRAIAEHRAHVGLLSLVLSLGLSLGLPSAAHCGGPLVTTTTGETVGWSDAVPVSYRTDLGGLGLLSHSQATSTVETLFTVWQDVPSATISYQRAGDLAVDVNSTNFGPYLGPYGGGTTPIGQNVVVFDADGEIFELLYGVGSGVIGFAGPTFLSDGMSTVPIGSPVPPGAKIIEAMAFLNGRFIDGVDDPANGNYEVSEDMFDAAFTHEFGHFSGLDHTQIHGIQGPPESDVYRTSPIETLYPFLLDASQGTLERDDVVSLSSVYPTPSFGPSTVTLRGTIRTSTATPLSGINVVARNIANDADAISCVSGAAIVTPGEYVIRGLQPGAQYRVDIQEVDAFNYGGSRVGPFSPPIILPGPPESYDAAMESNDPQSDNPAAFTAVSGTAGASIAGIDIMVNRQKFGVVHAAFENSSKLSALALGDFTGDNVPDLVAPMTGFTPGNYVVFYRGRGDGTFDPAQLVNPFPGNESVVTGQFNPAVDSFLDVAVVSFTLHQVRVYRGNGSGGFSAPSTFSIPGCSSCFGGLLAGDLDANGYADIVVLNDDNTSHAVVYALLGNGLGGFTMVTTTFAGGSPLNLVAVANVSGGPQADIVAMGAGSFDPNLYVLVGDGSGHFTLQPVNLSAYTIRLGEAAAAADFNEDGLTDLAFTNYYPVGGPTNWTRTFVDLLLNNGAGGFTHSARYQIPEAFQTAMVVDDFDRDGHLDIASTGATFGIGSPGAKVTIAYGNGHGAVRDLGAVWGLDEFPHLMVGGDLNRDGWTDLLVGNEQAAGMPNVPLPGQVLLNRTAVVSVALDPSRGDQLQMSAGAPTPFRNETSIHFALARESHVTLEIFGVEGRRVRRLVDGVLAAGPHSVEFDGRNEGGAPLPSGVYLCSLRGSDGRIARRLVLTR